MKELLSVGLLNMVKVKQLMNLEICVPGAVLSEVDEIRSYKGSNIEDLLTSSDEKLSFIMEDDEA